ncbi:hypothetical protein ZIOFF_046605 [Zingiber officinale]|uniref:BHLH domain-containing protein n=1 Tax=Zingiber officinale TaxID=94328 RepID=A0A8J5FPK5_ZINOF|nr:hypothetical protein ZIOFF_046605 [Zingiber officinale]
MDYFFLLGSHDRRWFLQLAGSVLGCAYICTWCPAANQLISMEGWQREEDNSINPSSSSGIVSSRLFAAYRRSLCSIQRGCIPGLAFASGLNYLEIKDADIMNLAALNEQRQFYQMNMEMSIQQVFSKIFIQKSLLKEEDCLIQLTPNHEKSHHSSSSSSLRSRSLSIGSHESLLFEAPASRYCEDNKAMTRAMLAVISSAPSSSSQPQQGYPPTAFMVYHRNNLDKSESSNNLGGGQRMIKAGIEILRRKDKASVLADTKNYLNSLRAQIEELEERNQMLELMQFVEGEIGESDEKVEVRVIRASESASRASQFINLEVVVIVREECEMMNLVVRLLEWLKQREATHLVAMEARTAPQSTGAILRRVGVGLQLKVRFQ